MFEPGDYGVGTFNGFDLKPCSDNDKLEYLRVNCSLEGKDDGVPARGAWENSKYVQEVLQAKREHQEGQGLLFSNLHSESSRFLTMVS